MAVYRCEVKRISRTSGRSAVASAAYRTAERLRDEQGNEGAGKVHDYRRRAPGVAYRETMAPKDAPEWATQRGRLWNEAERAERRKDANTARELIGSLPHELDDVQRIEAVRGASAELIDRFGVAVDIAIHRPDRKGDQRNHHAHLMMTTRRMDREGFTEKTRELDDRKTGPQEINAIREIWERQMNLALERAGLQERVSRLSNAAQGIEREPQEKVGERFTAFARQGIQPRAAPDWQEVARRRKLTKDENRPLAEKRHRLERQSLAKRYAERAQKAEQDRQAADLAAMRANAARVMKMRESEAAPKVSPMRANMVAQAARKAEGQRTERQEREKQEAIARALHAAQQAKAAQQRAREQGPAHIADALMRDTSEAQRGQQDAQQQAKDEARKLEEERQRAAEVSVARAWERQRQAELRQQREAKEQQNQNPRDLGRVRKPPEPGESS